MPAMEITARKISQISKATHSRGVILGNNGKRLEDHTETQVDGQREATTIGNHKGTPPDGIKMFELRITGRAYNLVLGSYQSPRMLLT